MPQLTSLNPAADPQSTIIYGPSLSGKTTLAMLLAKGFKILYIDGEKGTPVLHTLPLEYKKNIFVQSIIDNKDNYSFVITAIQLASGQKVQVCDKHGVVMNKPMIVPPCKECADAVRKQGSTDGIINEWELNKLDPKEWIVVFDSFTQLTSSANALVTRKLRSDQDYKGELSFEEFKHWRAQGTFLEKFLDYVQTARYHVVAISHEQLVKQEDGTDKVVPAGGTQDFARKITRYFNNAIYCTIKNKKHIIISTTTGDPRVQAGTRTQVAIDPSTLESRTKGMLALYGK